MGPQPFGCGRPMARRRLGYRGPLQWGRNLSVAEGLRPPKTEAKELPLQWGRNLSVAEGPGPRRPVHWDESASMGPQPFGCGRTRQGAPVVLSRRASMGPQPFGCGRTLVHELTWIYLGRLQWAATFRLRKGRGPTHGAYPSSYASMGPQPFGCGRRRRAAPPELKQIASMGPQPFGCGRAVVAFVGTGIWLRFNGAATFRLRKAVVAAIAILAVIMLQWGRNLSVAEGGTQEA